MKTKHFCFGMLLLLAMCCPLAAQDKMLDILKSEMNRELTKLKTQDDAPYYLSYRVNETRSASVSASFGTITGSDESDDRIFNVSVRIGSNQLDNSHEIRGDMLAGFLDMIPSMTKLPTTDNENAIRQIIWKATNEEFRAAADKYAKVKANVTVKVTNEDTSADFSRESAPAIYYEEPFKPGEFKFDRASWEEKLKKYTRPFLDEADIYSGTASVSSFMNRKYFVSSEGSSIAENRTGIRMFISGFIKSEDGMELPLYKTYFAYKPEDLPSDDQVLKDVKEMISKLIALKKAPIVDPYTGPALMTGRASGVFFHEIFGHRVEGHRQKSEDEGQTFKKKIGEKVLPEDMSIVFHPELKNMAGDDLNGYYKYDDEGVQAQTVSVIDKGIMKNFLMNRSPIENFSKSNGHGRAQAGYKTVCRQSNLVLETKDMKSWEELRKLLIDECKKQGKTFGYLFSDITGGFTITGRDIPNSFNVMPTEVYRVYTDGRPDELVRGVDLVGTPLAMFAQIAEAGGDYEVFNGTCGAESGGVPVSSVCPALFIKQIEMQKKSKSQEKPPLLPRPGSTPDKD